MCTDILAAVCSLGKQIIIFVLLVQGMGVGQCENVPVCFISHTKMNLKLHLELLLHELNIFFTGV